MVSAQQSRLKKKNEVITLNKMIKDKDDKMSDFVEKILIKRLKGIPDVMNLIMSDINKQWPNENKNTTSPAFMKQISNKKLQTDQMISEFRETFSNTFKTDEEELAKFKPNDEKEVEEQDEESED